ncbi:L-2-hydroxyglutarate oxidase [Agrobacterium sp. LAD9]|uniref:L-2-hydroxyglutarate oxidase n=1 Tax=Agrobacterium sp. LAD9 TaxID=2055153 RepID=UPI00192D4187|nr:L-2-hydroxyglutarate oxidase [Agrobacterium sp. LAD9]
MTVFDFCVIGGGIVGLATAHELLTRTNGAKVIVIEKETALGSHQTGHNSGVIHAGVYYKTGSLKAQLCVQGAKATKDFCLEYGIPFATPGKLIVATDKLELERMRALKINAEGNGTVVEELDTVALRQCEPEIAGVAALRVKSSGIVDYQKICIQLSNLIRQAGGEIVFGDEVTALRETSDEVEVVCRNKTYRSRKVIACAGLQADRIARLSGVGGSFRIVPFRGEYYKVREEKKIGVTHMIYPVPDPALPFLGIHLTPTIHGEMTVGPNAVLGFSREGYQKLSFNLRDALSIASFSGFWGVARKNWRTGLEEFSNSISKAKYMQKCQKYYPDLVLEDLVPYRAGIRAQAITAKGDLLHDFLFLNTKRTLHVGNAPSPAATSAIPIARMIAERITN